MKIRMPEKHDDIETGAKDRHQVPETERERPVIVFTFMYHEKKKQKKTREGKKKKDKKGKKLVRG